MCLRAFIFLYIFERGRPLVLWQPHNKNALYNHSLCVRGSNWGSWRVSGFTQQANVRMKDQYSGCSLLSALQLFYPKGNRIMQPVPQTSKEEITPLNSGVGSVQVS